MKENKLHCGACGKVIESSEALARHIKECPIAKGLLKSFDRNEKRKTIDERLKKKRKKKNGSGK